MIEKRVWLNIDEKRTVGRICNYLQKTLLEADADAYVLGLSGGIDSTVLAALTARAVSPSRVYVRYLFDRTSNKSIRHCAQAVAAWLGLDLQMTDISPTMEEIGIYAPLPMRITARSGTLNRMLHDAYTRIFGETPFISTLRAGQQNGETSAQPIRGFEMAIRDPENAMNRRHRFRRELLEKEAERHNWLLIGAANRTEWKLGWFVKDGIDDLPIQPLKGLYKTQVRQLATFLDVPKRIREQPPSPDMIRGITDEYALGMRFYKLDLALDCLDSGVPEDALATIGITHAEIEHVRTMNRLSEWKRTPSNIHPPVDGGPRSDLRRSAVP